MKTSVTPIVSFTEIHHLARLNWEKDGCPEGLDMEYYLAAESLLVTVRPHQTSAEKKTNTGTERNAAVERPIATRRARHSCASGRSTKKISEHATIGHSGERTTL